jgi:transposase
MNEAALYVGMDVHKATVAIAVAEPGRNGEVRFIGNVANKSSTVIALLRKLEDKHGAIECAYEAGPCAYTLYRQLTAASLACIVVAPSKIPTSPGRVKNDYRDAISLAKLLRAGELTAVWVPEPIHEAMRDLVRARHAASFDVRKARQRLQSYLLLRDRHYALKMWGYRHREWLSRQLFEHQAQQIAYQGYLNALEQAEARRTQLEEQIAHLLPNWSLAPVVTALQALRGVAPIIAVSIVAEVGDVSRFDSPRKLMAYLGLIPVEYSSGASIRARGITKQGNSVLRSLLFEAAWAYRFMAKVSVAMKARRPDDIPQSALDIAWKAQVRLCGRYRRLLAKGKKSQVAITAVARELLGFVWAIANAVGSTQPLGSTQPVAEQAA